MFRTKKLSKHQRLPLVFGYPKAYNVGVCGLILISVQSPKFAFPTTPPLQNWKVLFNFERKNRDKSEQWEYHIANIPERVLTKRWSFFVTKMAYIKRKSWKIRIFYFLYSILRFHCILLYWFQAIFVLWTFFTSPFFYGLLTIDISNL